ncbi:hypothetical protein CE91St56_20050 [Lachnospiraceae bacterium]|nr:hypothetical protein CE91St56_20050 [Lachnospiraceae bacterium]GKH40949.1 hypothetical protein CE91St57_19230 [Lachnospiraceae bacterium]
MMRKGIASVRPRLMDWEAIEFLKRDIRRLDSMCTSFAIWRSTVMFYNKSYFNSV